MGLTLKALFIYLPSGSSAIARRQRDRIFFLSSFLALARTTLSISIRTVGGGEEEGRWCLNLCQKPDSSSENQHILGLFNMLPEKLSTSLPVGLNTSHLADEPFRSTVQTGCVFNQLLK